MEHLSEILSFIGGLIGGSLLTVTYYKFSMTNSNNTINQNNNTTGGDIVGGNKSKGN